MAEYYARIEAVSEGDLVAFRDAVLTYCRAQSLGQELILEATPEAADLANWLGLEFRSGTPPQGGNVLLDPQREAAGMTVTRLASTETFPSCSLERYRNEGFLGETLFAALVRSSYGPPTEGYFPTRSELKVTYDQHPLRQGAALWDDDYLSECQEFFMEELTPAQLLQAVVASAAPSRRRCWEAPLSEWGKELRSALFLVGETSQNVKPLADLLSRLLDRSREIPDLNPLLNLPNWEHDQIAGALSSEQWEGLSAALFPGFEDHQEQLVYALGPRFLSWRRGLVKA